MEKVNTLAEIVAEFKARSIQDTLSERGSRYGGFDRVAGVSQHLQAILNCAGSEFDDVQQEALQMICSKLARISCGDPSYIDSWHDIAGYATLVVEDLKKGEVKHERHE